MRLCVEVGEEDGMVMSMCGGRERRSEERVGVRGGVGDDEAMLKLVSMAESLERRLRCSAMVS